MLQGKFEHGLYTIKKIKVNSQAKGTCFTATKDHCFSNFSVSDDCIPYVKISINNNADVWHSRTGHHSVRTLSNILLSYNVHLTLNKEISFYSSC